MLSKVVGQEIAKGLLGEALKSRSCASGYIFHGPGGVGKRTFALEVGRVLNCFGEGGGECECQSCKYSYSGSHPDVQYFSPRNEVFTVDMVRHIREQSLYRPHSGEWRVLILDNAEDMSPEASNAFLKILESPPKHLIFIMLCEDLSSVIPTLISRCVDLPFFPLSSADIAEIMHRQGLDPGTWASVSMGSVALAQGFTQGDSAVHRAESLSLFVELWKGDLGSTTYLAKRMGSTRDKVLSNITYFMSFLRDVWMLRGGESEHVRNTDIVDVLSVYSEYPAELLSIYTYRTCELERVLKSATLEVQVRAYLTALAWACGMALDGSQAS